MVLVRRIFSALALLAFGWSAVGAQQDPNVRPREFGTQDTNILHIPAVAFAPFDYADLEAHGLLRVPRRLYAPVYLPTGARIVSLGAYLRVNFFSQEARVQLMFRTAFSESHTVGALSTSGQDGDVHLSVPVDHTVKNGLQNGEQYEIQVVYPGTLASYTCPSNCPLLHGVDIVWQRQVGPAPGTASFADVPISHAFFRAIEALASSGITQGCGGGNFCPNGNVTRGEMAALLARSLGLHWPN
jgi:hypothetical protein